MVEAPPFSFAAGAAIVSFGGLLAYLLVGTMWALLIQIAGIAVMICSVCSGAGEGYVD